MTNPIAPRDRDNDDDKLLAGWSVSGDWQIIWLGVAVVAFVVLAGFAWPAIFGSSSPFGGVGDGATGPVVSGITEEAGPSSTSIAPTSTASTSTTATTDGAVDLSPAVAAAVSGFDGITGSANGTLAVLDGFVGTRDESASAEAAALTVQGITGVDNRLVVLESSVLESLVGSGVEAPTVAMEGTSAVIGGIVSNDVEAAAAIASAESVEGITPPVTNDLRILQPEVQAAVDSAAAITDSEVTVETESGSDPLQRVATLRGTVASDEVSAAAEAAATAVPGVTRVDNQLVVDAAAGVSEEAIVEDLNALFELEPIQFRSGSADILDASFATLDRAATILQSAPAEGIRIEVQGYTDTQGGDGFNQTLSENRAAAVREYLVEAGVSGDILTSAGYGETEQFGPEFADNRRVQFQLL